MPTIPPTTTHNTHATHVWTERGHEWYLLTVSGRERVNPNKAVNIMTISCIHSNKTNCVNAHTLQRLHQKLLATHPTGPIYDICDSARYYKDKELSAWLAGTRLVQVFLPSYSPNLKLIERLWKFLRQRIIILIANEKQCE